MSAADLFKWSERAPSSLPRAGCAAGAVGGKLLIAGGTFWQNGQKYWSDRVESFDASTNRWESQPPLPQSRGDAASAVVGDALYVLGGGADGPAERSGFVFSAGNWKADTTITLPEPRRSSAAAVFDGTIYLIGGLAGTGSEFATATSSVWAAKPGGGWRTCAPMPGLVRFNAAIGVMGDAIIVAGGCTPEKAGVRNLDEILRYDPRLDTWSDAGRLPFPVRGSCGLADDSRLLMIGGYTDKFLTCIQAVNVTTGQVTVVGELPCGLADTRFVRIGFSICGVTGENGIKMRFAGTIESGIHA
jgi:N-acetylneuraminic acid mutarotase